MPETEPEPEPVLGPELDSVCGFGDIVDVVVGGDMHVEIKSVQQSFDFLHKLSQ